MGARYIGLGEMGAAVSGQPEAPAWNPAALSDLSGPLLSLDLDVAHQSPLSDDVLYQNASLRGRKLAYLGFAASNTAFFYRPLAGIDQTTVIDPLDPQNNFTKNELQINQFGISVADQAGEKGSGATIGMNISYLSAHRAFARAQTGLPPVVEIADGNGFSLDLGGMIKKEVYTFGFAFANLPGVLYWNNYKPDQLPTIFRGGLAYNPVPLFSFITEYEKRFYRNGLPKPRLWHLGAEVTLASWLQIRGGSFGEDLNDPDKVSYAGGLSVVSSKRHQFDFAVKTYRVNDEKVNNYYLSILFPISAK